MGSEEDMVTVILICSVGLIIYNCIGYVLQNTLREYE